MKIFCFCFFFLSWNHIAFAFRPTSCFTGEWIATNKNSVIAGKIYLYIWSSLLNLNWLIIIPRIIIFSSMHKTCTVYITVELRPPWIKKKVGVKSMLCSVLKALCTRNFRRSECCILIPGDELEVAWTSLVAPNLALSLPSHHMQLMPTRDTTPEMGRESAKSREQGARCMVSIQPSIYQVYCVRGKNEISRYYGT